MKAINILSFLCLLSSAFLLHGAFYEQQGFGDSLGSSCQGEYNDMVGYVDGTNTGSQEYDTIHKSYCLDKRLDTNPSNKKDKSSTEVYGILNARRGNPFYDHCCYIRFQKSGSMYHGCIGLKEAEYLDIGETIYKIENGKEPRYLGISDSKVYQFDCKSFYPYIKASLIALLALFF